MAEHEGQITQNTPPETTDSPGPEASLETQHAEMSMLTAGGRFREITPERFPGIDPVDVAFARFDGTNVYINHSLARADIAQNPGLQAQLARRTTKLMQQRDRELSEALGNVDGEPDEGAILYQRATTAPSSDALSVINTLVGMGLPHEVTPESAPTLATMHPRSVAALRMEATTNHLRILAAARDCLRPPTGVHTSASPTDAVYAGLGEQIAQQQGQLREHVVAYLGTGQRRAAPPRG